jgi:autotransporter-associated beta strand protein
MKRRTWLPVAVGAIALGVWSAWGEVDCPGDYAGHLQGIAVDDDGNIYWSFTTVLVKTDAQGGLLRQKSVPTHYGDLTWHDGKVYVAVNLGLFNEEPGAADSWVYVHDGDTLDLLATHAVPEAVHGAGGMEWHDGRFFVVGGLPATHTANYVYEYTEAFEFVRRHVIESGQTLKGIQTVCRGRDGTWWFGCYGSPTVTLRTDEGFALLGIYEFNAAVGIARTQEDGAFLIGRNRAAGNRNFGWLVEERVETMTKKGGQTMNPTNTSVILSMLAGTLAHGGYTEWHLHPGNGVETNVAAVIGGPVNVTVNPVDSGGGIVTLNPANAYYGRTALGCGTLVVEKFADGGAASSVGASAAAPENMVIGRGTLRYTGPATTTDRGLSFALNSGAACVFHTDTDLTFTGPVLLPGGSFFKVGAGTLAFFGSGTNSIGATAQKVNEDGIVVLSANGDAPTQGMGSLIVLDGTVAWGAPGQTVIVGGTSGTGEAMIGGYTTDAGLEKPGFLDIYGGTTFFNNYLVVGRHNGTFTTAPTPLQSRVRIFDGSVTVASLSMGRNKKNYGSFKYKASPLLELHGGTLRINSNIRIGDDIGGDSTVRITGGLMDNRQTVYFGFQSGGTTNLLVVSDGGRFYAPAVDLGDSGGTYSARTHTTIEVTRGGIYNAYNTYCTTGTGILRLDGGILRPNFTGNASYIGGSLAAAYLSTNGVAIDLTSNTGVAYFDAPFVTDPALGAAPDGGVTVSGVSGGTAVFNGAHTYTGPTVLSSGTLVVNGSLPAGTALTLSPGTTLALTNGVMAQTVGLLTVGAAAKSGTWDLALGVSGDGSGRLTVSGALTAAGANPLRVWLYDPATGGGVSADGTYTLLQYATAYAGAIAPQSVSIGNPVSGKLYAFSTSESGPDTQLKVTVSDGPVGDSWINAAGGAWESGANWQGGTPVDAIGAVATFATEAQAGGAAVTVAGTVRLGGAVLSSANPYAFGGGTLAFDNGGAGAVWSVAAGSHEIGSDVRLDGALALATVAGATQTVSGAVSGSGGLSLNPAASGGGTVRLTGENTFAGRFATGCGTVEIGSLSVLGAAPDDAANLTLGPGTLRVTDTAPSSTSRGLLIDAGSAAATLINDGDLTLDGAIGAASGALIKRGAGTLTLAGTGALNVGATSSTHNKDSTVVGENGDSPVRSFASLTVAEGKMAWGRAGQTVTLNDNLWVGAKTTANAGEEVTAELEINGGVTIIPGRLTVGLNNGTPVTAPVPLHPRLVINGGEIYAGGFQMNYDNKANDPVYREAQDVINTQAETVMNGGLLEIAGAFTPAMMSGLGNCAFLTLNGGTIRHLHSDGIWVGTAEPSGKAVITLNGGLLETQGDLRIVRYEGESWLHLNGGILRACDIQRGGGTGVAHVYFNGGTFQPIATTLGSDYRTMNNLANVWIQAGGLIIDTSLCPTGYAYTVQQAMQRDPALGADPDGGIVKQGEGQLLIRAVAGGYAFTGPVRAEAGILGFEASALHANAVIAHEGATLLGHSATAWQWTDSLTLGTNAAAAGSVLLDLAYLNGRTAPFAVSNTLEIVADVEVCLHPSGADAHVWSMPVGSAYTVLVCKAGQTLDAGRFRGAARFPNRSATFQKVTLSGGAYGGWQAVVMSVADRAATEAAVWDATASGGAWETAANWLADAVPASGAAQQLVFANAGGAGVPVTLADAKTFGRLRLESAAGRGYAFSGGAMTFAEISPDLPAVSAPSGAHRISSPLQADQALVVDTRSNATVEVAGTVAGSAPLLLNAETAGGGTTVLSGPNTFTGGVTVRSGKVVIDSLASGGQPSAVGASSVANGNLVLGPGTLHYTGPDTATDRGVQFNPGSDRTAIFRTDNDVTILGPVTSASGAFVKSGAGTLRIAGAGPHTLSTAHNNAGWTRTQFWPSNGDSPQPSSSGQPGFPGVLVDEGRLVLGGPGQSVTINGEMWISGQARGWAYTTDSATLDILGGEVTGSHLTIGRNFLRTVGQDTYATVNMYDGTFSCDYLILAYDTAYKNTSVKATLNLFGGTFNVGSQFRIGMEQGHAANSPLATVNVYGGELNHQHASQGISFGWEMDPACSAVLNVFGGLVNERWILRMARNNAKSWLNLHGGILRAENITHVASPAGESRVLFNGGVYQPLGVNAAQRVLQGLTSAAVSTNGAVIDTAYLAAGAVYTVAQPLTHDAALGGAPDGGLRKLGAGTLVLAGANAFTGPVTVEGGTLRVAHGQAIPDLARVTSSGTLDLDGAVRDIPRLSGSGPCVNGTARVTVEVSPGETEDAPAGAVMAFDSLAFAPGAAFVCHSTADGLPSGTNDILAVAGLLSAEGAGFIDFGRAPDAPLALPYAAVVMTYGTSDAGFAGWRARGTGHPEGKVALRLVRDESGPVKVVRAEVLYTGTRLILK